jgi:hypothetical protein
MASAIGAGRKKMGMKICEDRALEDEKNFVVNLLKPKRR